MRSYEFYIKPGTGECAQASIPLPEPESGVIYGRVTDESGPVPGALAVLLAQDTEEMVCYTVTDSMGRFWFGPLAEDRLYFLRVQKPDGAVRLVELGG